MELNENLKNNLLRLRKDRNVTQDVLATVLDISVQAISKWETGVSLPDIMQLPRIAKFYGVTIDYLFFHEGDDRPMVNEELPDDNILRVVQFYGNKMLGADLWERDKSIELKLPGASGSTATGPELNVEIWGNANLHGDVGGNVESGGGLNCGNIGGNAESGGGLNCGNIGGNAESGGSLNCGNIGGNAECGGNLSGGNITGSVESGGSVNCGEIGQNVESGGDINCSSISGQVSCEGNIRCREITGDVRCEGNIVYEK